MSSLIQKGSWMSLARKERCPLIWSEKRTPRPTIVARIADKLMRYSMEACPFDAVPIPMGWLIWAESYNTDFLCSNKFLKSMAGCDDVRKIGKCALTLNFKCQVER